MSSLGLFVLGGGLALFFLAKKRVEALPVIALAVLLILWPLAR